MHPQIDEIVKGLVARKKYVYMCTNALLLQRKAAPLHAEQVPHVLRPHGWREGASRSFRVQGRRLRDRATTPSARRSQRGFRVTTNTTIFDGVDTQIRARLLHRDDGCRRRRHDALAGLLLRQGARPAALHGTRGQPVDVPQDPLQSRPALALQYVAAVSRVPDGQAPSATAPPGACPPTASSAGRSPAT